MNLLSLLHRNQSWFYELPSGWVGNSGAVEKQHQHTQGESLQSIWHLTLSSPWL